jgi:hypothetical protein
MEINKQLHEISAKVFDELARMRQEVMREYWITEEHRYLYYIEEGQCYFEDWKIRQRFTIYPKCDYIVDVEFSVNMDI